MRGKILTLFLLEKLLVSLARLADLLAAPKASAVGTVELGLSCAALARWGISRAGSSGAIRGTLRTRGLTCPCTFVGPLFALHHRLLGGSWCRRGDGRLCCSLSCRATTIRTDDDELVHRKMSVSWNKLHLPRAAALLAISSPSAVSFLAREGRLASLSASTISSPPLSAPLVAIA